MLANRKAFDRELVELEAEIICTGALVAEGVAAAREALTGGDRELARKVVHDHAVIDKRARQCEATAYGLLARQQPAAGDLRFLLTVVRLSHEFERSSKLVTHVAAFAARPHGLLRPRIGGLLSRMATEASRLFQGALDAYAARDVDGAEALDVWDDKMDELHRELLLELFTAPQSLQVTLELVLVGRYLERIADHAVLIGARVRYLVLGEL